MSFFREVCSLHIFFMTDKKFVHVFAGKESHPDPGHEKFRIRILSKLSETCPKIRNPTLSLVLSL
jgi:hypothetical protein